MRSAVRQEKRHMQRTILLLCVAFVGPVACAQAVDSCPIEQGVTLQVLGSGGPIADDGRASAGYIVWIDGESRIMVDTGLSCALAKPERNLPVSILSDSVIFIRIILRTCLLCSSRESFPIGSEN